MPFEEGRGIYTERREEGREGEIYREAGRRKGGGDIQRGGKKEGRGRYTERREEGREGEIYREAGTRKGGGDMGHSC